MVAKVLKKRCAVCGEHVVMCGKCKPTYGRPDVCVYDVLKVSLFLSQSLFNPYQGALCDNVLQKGNSILNEFYTE